MQKVFHTHRHNLPTKHPIEAATTTTIKAAVTKALLDVDVMQQQILSSKEPNMKLKVLDIVKMTGFLLLQLKQT